MADKENATPAPAAAPGPRLTRAAVKRAAATSAAASSGAKRKRVALSELPTLSNASILRAPSHPVKPSKPAADKEAYKPAAAAAGGGGGGGEPDGDPRLCGAYASDIYSYLRAMEADAPWRPAPNYIEAVQVDVSASMRAVLIDWLVDVAEEYKLQSDTLYLAVCYVDRFLSANKLCRSKLQLLGVAAMLVAAKYEEITPPHVEDFCFITDNTYTKQEVVKMESDILKLLQFEMGNPTAKSFLRRFLRSGQYKKCNALQFESLGAYLCELSLLDYSCLRFLPSVVAASVVFLVRLTIDPNINPWSKEMQKLTGYKVSELKDCIMVIHDLQLNKKSSSLVAIRDKYKQHRFKCVSTLLPPVEIPDSYFQDLTN